MNNIFSLIGTILIGAAPAVASDLPYGADAIPYLARRSTVVTLASGPERLGKAPAGEAANPQALEVTLYTVRSADVLKGKVERGTTLQVAVSESMNVKDAKQLDQRILFLDGPLGGEKKVGIGVVDDRAVYLLVSGRHGAIPASGNRLEAIRDYLDKKHEDNARDEVKFPEVHLAWAERYIESSDPFLQRSAVLELARHTDTPETIGLLADLLSSDAAQPRNKRDAVYALQLSNSPVAVMPLKTLAEDRKAPKSLRDAAVHAVGSLPGGDEELRVWSEGEDEVLAPAAKATIRQFQRPATRRP